MNTQELNAKIEELNEWEMLLEEAKAHAEALKDEIKEDLHSKNLEELNTGKYIVRWTSVLSNRFDTTAFKKKFGELYKQYTKQVESKRFSIA